MDKLQDHSQTVTKESLAKLAKRYLGGFGSHKASVVLNQAAETQTVAAQMADLEQQAHLALEVAEAANLAKSNFLAAMSHELRTPINAIVGFCEILDAPQSEMLSAEIRKGYLHTIIENAAHLQSMINDILDVTRLERGSFQLVEQNNDAAEIIEAALKASRKLVEHAQISIVAHLIDDVAVRGDLVRLKQVVQNLVTNAIKFSPSGSVVNIDMLCGEQKDFVLSIRDAGIGISAEDALRAFESFLQVDEGASRRFAGMGLGLSIARRIARLHGGDVTLNGDIGIGTEARLTLPAARMIWPGAQRGKKDQVAA